MNVRWWKVPVLVAFGAVLCGAGMGSTNFAQAEPKPPIKLAVFDFELDDFSAGGPIAGESAVETAMLHKVTLLARQLLAQSGLFEIVDVSPATNEMVKTHWLRKCNGCDAQIARELGADMSFVAYFRKISIMEQFLEFRNPGRAHGRTGQSLAHGSARRNRRVVEARDHMVNSIPPRRTRAGASEFGILEVKGSA